MAAEEVGSCRARAQPIHSRLLASMQVSFDLKGFCRQRLVSSVSPIQAEALRQHRADRSKKRATGRIGLVARRSTSSSSGNVE
eukprot:SAG31_NODE_28868_length_404_cov_0.845902_1_plen_82_part_10